MGEALLCQAHNPTSQFPESESSRGPGDVRRNVATTLRQPGFDFELGREAADRHPEEGGDEGIKSGGALSQEILQSKQRHGILRLGLLFRVFFLEKGWMAARDGALA